jgi:hypothetical protein
MAVLFQVGWCSATDLHDDFGHMACTLGGINYESRGAAGCVRGDSARGARSRVFGHRFHLVLSDAAATRARAYADGCVGHRYIVGQVPNDQRGGDCSGYVSGILCSAAGRDVMRLFTTATWSTVCGELGFTKGLGGGGVLGGRISDIGRPDRPFPGRVFQLGVPSSNHVRWIQARLNFVADGAHPELDGQGLRETGEFDRATKRVVRSLQRGVLGDGTDRDIDHEQDAEGTVGRHTWHRLNRLR